MIRVVRATEPDGFDAQVRQPGLRDIAELVGKAPDPPRATGRPLAKVADIEALIPSKSLRPYWTKCLDDLMTSYGRVCAYSCFYIHPVTGARSADHFAPKSADWQRIYEWTNYRLCCSRINAGKGVFTDVLDPFEIQDGWFELELVGFQVIPGAHVPPNRRPEVEATIARLKLDDYATDRAETYEMYRRGDISYRHLSVMQPFVAREIARQGKV